MPQAFATFAHWASSSVPCSCAGIPGKSLNGSPNVLSNVSAVRPMAAHIKAGVVKAGLKKRSSPLASTRICRFADKLFEDSPLYSEGIPACTPRSPVHLKPLQKPAEHSRNPPQMRNASHTNIQQGPRPFRRGQCALQIHLFYFHRWSRVSRLD